eukprot:TRINITY_DN5377_c0_g4_i1.p1 TRINITY_DN5377_c0_g4~~TRINITY_DN5377_c0_g4_i1.p1  ORF type:complete len:646 (-),score=159.91 TRINITY_DN5377_c0_g4_i1:563-2500(-)
MSGRDLMHNKEVRNLSISEDWSFTVKGGSMEWSLPRAPADERLVPAQIEVVGHRVTNSSFGAANWFVALIRPHFIEYQINVQPRAALNFNNGRQIWRRYSEFLNLSHQMRSIVGAQAAPVLLPSLPPKVMFPTDPVVVEERENGLGNFLASALLLCSRSVRLMRIVAAFLDADVREIFPPSPVMYNLVKLVRFIQDPCCPNEVEIYSGEDRVAGHSCVIRRFSRKLMTLATFWKHVDMMRRLAQHPSILDVVDAFYDDQYFYVVREECTGTLLDFASMHLSELSALKIMQKLVSALEFCHEQGAVHLRISLDNVELFTKEPDSVRILGFEFPQLIDRCEEEMDANLCDVFHSAPEILNPKLRKSADPDSLVLADMWSLGTILYMIVIGRRPFTGNSRKEILQNIMSGILNFPSEVPLSNALRDFISRLLIVDPSRRMTSEGALRHPWIEGRKTISDETNFNPHVFEGLRNVKADSDLKRVISLVSSKRAGQSEKEQLLLAFQALDRDGSGFLDLQELVRALERSGHSKPDAIAEAMQLLREFDENMDGVIGFEEFQTMVERSRISLNESRVLEIFKELDQDGNGFVTQAEIELYFADHKDLDQTLEFDVLSIFKDADANKDGRISFEEFMQAITRAKGGFEEKKQ